MSDVTGYCIHNLAANKCAHCALGRASTGHRPTSYGTGVTGAPTDAKKPTTAEESYRKAKELARLGAWYPPPIKLTVEQARWELERLAPHIGTALRDLMDQLIDQLPADPELEGK